VATTPAVSGVGRLDAAEHELRRAFLTEVETIPGGRRISRCLQCGTCTGSCPVSYAMDLSPRELIARFRAGDIRSILASRTIWLCASCYACTVRCPAGIKVTEVIYALKRLALARGIRPRRYPTFAVAESFVSQVERYGRNNEPRFMLGFYRRAGFRRAFSALPMALRLFLKGRIGLGASRIRGLADLRRVMRRAEQMELRVEQELTGGTAPVGYGVVGARPPRALPAASARVPA
jgi:heterodisulfide reductase subunit C